MSLTNGRILELGAGAGLPAIYAMTLGAASVTWQDLNAEVLRAWTIPNVLLNRTNMTCCVNRFLAANWNALALMIKDEVS